MFSSSSFCWSVKTNLVGEFCFTFDIGTSGGDAIMIGLFFRLLSSPGNAQTLNLNSDEQACVRFDKFGLCISWSACLFIFMMQVSRLKV